MTEPRSHAACRLLAVALALALGLFGQPAGAADETPDVNTFSTPGYPTAARQGGMPAPNGAGANSDGTRPIRNGAAADPRTRGTAGNGNGNDDDSTRRSLPPAPKPSEFQRFVEAATGRLLPIFGSSFFNDPGNNGTLPIDNVPVGADYVVGPGDEIVIRAWGAIDVDYRATVDRNGLLNLPKVGSFSVSGVRASDLERHLRTQIGRLYTNFDLSASLGQLRGLRVFVVGPAQRPGVLTLASQSTLLSAIVAAGGPAPNGSMRKVQLRRDGKVISELDVYGFLVQGDKAKDVQLAAGDVVVFQPAGARAAVTGALDTPAIYELKGAQEPVGDVLRYAGGLPTLANPNRAQLERVDTAQPKAARFVEDFRLDAAGRALPLRDGDVLTLLPISPQFANAVTLRGHVAQPLRYPYRPGMRIRDLIPDAEALVTPDFYRRKNVLVQVIEDDDALLLRGDGLPAATSGPAQRGAAAYPGAARAAQTPNGTRVPTDAAGNGGAYGSAAGSLDPDDASATLSASERLRRARDRTLVNASRRAPMPLFDELNWDYAVIERLDPRDLTTRIIPFNLGKAVLQGDEANNLELRAGDVVTVYSQRDIRVPVARQTRLVSLEGEVSAPGVYQLLPGDTLQSVITRAGGFTPQAYLYGIEFGREETRAKQRENFAQAITRLEAIAAVQAAREAANRRDDPTTTTAVSSAATQAQLSRLRNMQPSGRIALELSPEVDSLAGLPAVPLEGGDRILVPPRPGFVTVAGAVVNSNAFLWRPGRTSGDYLRLAGADEAAEPANMFILRADGTVRHAGDNRGFFGRNSLQNEVMQPGDALIVPSQLDFESWGRAFVRNLKDFAQIFTGFGVGIAAIHSL